MKQQNVLVTGGAGYKGVLLVKKLLEEGHKVTIYDNFMYGYSSVMHLASEPKLSIEQLDIRNIEQKKLSQFDVVYHLAGISGMPACAANPHSADVINVEATHNLVSILGKEQILIYASTTSFYGATAKESTETTPVSPVSIYGRTKYEAEKIVQSRENSISLRFATVFGISPKMRADLMVNDFTYKAINERSLVLFAGQSKRTFIHIKDAIRAYIFAMDHADTMHGEIYNVGDEQLNYSKVDIANAVRRFIDYEIVDSSLPDLDIRNFLVSFKKIRNLGFHTEFNLDDGIQDLIKLYGFFKYFSPFNII
jgi:nucleoside-diphosphate-sugar epimerase